jgi:hypothetical protein
MPQIKMESEFYIPDEEFERIIEEAIKNNPDFVLVVRCKDCKHRVEGSKMCAHPKAIGWDAIEPDDDDFCSCGERKKADD